MRAGTPAVTLFGREVATALLVHAHPDDETLATGAVIAALTSAGVQVHLLTATGGEQGEVVPGTVGQPTGPGLVAARLRELSAAADVLGVQHRYLLGAPPARAPGAAPRRYTDSGMRWEGDRAVAAAEVPATALTAAEPAAVAADLAALFDVVRPDLVITYDAGGGYGHPDHAALHDATLAAAGRTPVAEIVTAEQAARCPAARIVRVDALAHRERVLRALTAHASQLTVLDSGTIRHVGGQRQSLADAEYLRLVAPVDPPPR